MKIVRKTNINDERNYWDITIPNNHNFVLENGNVVHNCGTGVGFSVERREVEKLPEVPEELFDTDTTIHVADSKIGWAKAYKELIQMLYAGQIPKWDMSKIRPAGERLKTFGGRSSGKEPLDNLFRFTVEIFQNARDRKLSSIECHDIMCKIAEIVVVGGVRRSALISLSNLTDERMRNAKTGQWWLAETQRALSNNSVAYTEKPDVGIFLKEWQSLIASKSGERGIFNRQAAKKQVEKLGDRRDSNHNFGTNPCSEIILRDKEFCNLTEVVVRPDDTPETLFEKVRLASILGTWQATLTDFRYLSKEWKTNCEEEALLGVSLTGIMDNQYTNGSYDKLDFQDEQDKLPALLTMLKEAAVDTNKKVAKQLGINPSAAITCVKPSGCQTLDGRIKTKDGVMTVEEIFNKNGIFVKDLEAGEWYEMKEKMYVYDMNNDEKQITKLYCNGLTEVYEIESEDGEKYKFTGNHQLLTDNGWKRVDELKENDEIISF